MGYSAPPTTGATVVILKQSHTISASELEVKELIVRLGNTRYFTLKGSGVAPDSRRSVGNMLHSLGYKKFLLKMAGQPGWVWINDQAATSYDTNAARLELGGQWPG